MIEVFNYEGKKINIIKKDDDIRFRAKTIASILKYSNSRKAILDHVDSEDKCSLNELKSRGNESLPLKYETSGLKPRGNESLPLKYETSELKSRGNESLPLKYETSGIKPRGNESLPLTWNTKNTIYINESGLYSLILRSDMDKAKEFKRWVTKEVLPSIRKTGRYEYNHKPFKMLTFNIQTEFDLHKKVVNFIRNHYPKALLNATLGENQINSDMRLRSYNLGYQKVSPDLIIQNQ